MQHLHRKTRATLVAFLGTACLVAPAPTVAMGPGFQTSCTQEANQAFNDGLSLLHNMMYVQAEAAFNQAAEADPSCIMAQWGIAMANFHPLWPGTPSEAETERGTAAAEKLASMTTDSALEEALVAAAAAFYAPGQDGYRAQISAWAEAQIAAAEENPENIDSAAFAALARLATAPRGPDRIEVNAQVGDTLDALHQLQPDHPGIIHYAIHAFDNPPLKERGRPYAEIYDKTAPNAPHALHMPAHIFTRTGDWEKSIDLNRRSARAALEQSGDTIQIHYAHAIDYMVYGHLQLGEYDEAARLVDEINAIDNHQVSFVTAYALAAAPVRLLLERDMWAEAAALSPDLHPTIPWEEFPQTFVMLWFAKGLGAARSGDVAAAQTAVAELKALHDAMKERGQDYWAKLTEGQILTVEAWIALAEGDEEVALIQQSAAADLEDEIGKSPVTPGHVLPARELLGDMLAQMNRKDEAADAYRATLLLSPNRARSAAALE
ncbi:tetratricopeptide repeat protein [Ruegeria sp. SCP11]|uniref:tetratricopeptide repeat protein n=1 Tax=Ruegeria sp. SCP11 TaxID=3141378 RepID=UPI003335B847